MFIDVHTHHGSLAGETVFQQDVHTLGIHPWHITAENIDNLILSFDQKLSENMFITCSLQEFIQNDKGIVAIGECGLDKLCHTPFPLQLRAFEHQVRKSEELHLPLILHCVKALDDVLQVRKQLRATQPWIFHGFRGKPQQLSQLLSKDIYPSFGFQYNKSSLLSCPLDKLLLETDDQSLPVSQLYESVAKDLNIPLQTLEEQIYYNINKVY